ncbi:hypothetical protein MTX78_10750 [Hymenobacter tibetensis]|uniref:Uncharacterized protein n=1 Tax=Hymenobacter tibetensis TaxID=497967 RepID=A0ABY4D3Q1_9BACT|nr:hypothetical protein [Hymenobacter tibetensis]UOG77060.1 hypothetical protein MTX78_10750 [Hymenobacter tibetensis]
MKFLFTTLLLAFGLSGVANAQKQDRHAELPGTGGPSSAQLSETTRQMCNSLRLNEGQYIRLRAINKIKATRLDEIIWQYKDDLTEQRIRISELEAQYEAECGRILTPSQLSMLHSEQQHDSVPVSSDPTEGGIG